MSAHFLQYRLHFQGRFYDFKSYWVKSIGIFIQAIWDYLNIRPVNSTTICIRFLKISSVNTLYKSPQAAFQHDEEINVQPFYFREWEQSRKNSRKNDILRDWQAVNTKLWTGFKVNCNFLLFLRRRDKELFLAFKPTKSRKIGSVLDSFDLVWEFCS